jgi:hypothetical protein
MATAQHDLLQQLIDRQAIAELIARLGVMLDDKQFDDVRLIVTDDVVVQTASGSALGPDAVVAKARRNHTVRTHHVITDVLIELDGDRAQARANLLATFAPEAPDSRLVIGGTEQAYSSLTLGEVYRFQAIRRDGEWRLSRIEATRLWSSQPLTAGALVGQIDRGDAPAAA